MYPALTVLQALKNDADPVLWVGGNTGADEALISRYNIPFKGIPAAGVHGVGLKKMPGNLVQLTKGYFAARRILREFRPDAILYTGGYVAAPMAVAARRYKSLVYIPDIEPGLALKFIQKVAKIIAVTVEETLQYTPREKRVVITGYPVRESVKCWTKETAKEHFALDDELPVVLFMGGSKGAR
ncbi:MAG TPA: UDP-N-acetylglucosamine--N-acetylmuramyl-(pentapeptide) pyrophosphoryl-undecaprenol N-acetylglucosamine transferase, partial [Bellilinea sp.]|nr:UDP-N-acetylglucosamine--N-acetylmuramyl-(pentapeptide) pyrophosphoryl-undecaprenol N-acetylglucosamine transferase [Bellilinea sp.]